MIVKRDFIYTPKGASRPLHIWLPDDYYHRSEHYPVMYFLDGHNLFLDQDATYEKSWGMAQFLSDWDKPMILVGIECGHEGYERLSEYLPYPAEGWFGQFQPMGEATVRWILEEIKPVIDQDYRTIPFRECTAIGGSSMGGIMALYAAVHFNRWFSKAACVSSAIGFCMEPLKADLAASDLSPDTRIYLSWGTKEARKDHQDRSDRSSPTYHNHKYISDFLRKKKCTVKLHCQVGGGHCEADWEMLVPTFMNFLWRE